MTDKPKPEAEREPTDDDDWLDDEPCSYCRGDGRDPYTDYLLPCPFCDGSGL